MTPPRLSSAGVSVVRDSAVNLSKVAQAAARKWSAVQVELHGKYSIERLRLFYRYDFQTRWYQVLFWCIATPIPCILINVALDIAPLEKPSAGRDANYVFWIRYFFSTTTFAFMAFKQIDYMTPKMEMTFFQLLLSGIVVALGCFLNEYVIAGFTPMPVPFCLLTSVPMYGTTSGIMLALFCGKKFKNDAAIRSFAIRAVSIICLETCLPFIYPIFIYGFNSIPQKFQNPYMILIPIIKISARNIMSKLVGNSDDIKPEVLVFNVDCFNSLYVSLAMQSSTTVSTALVMMFIDCVQGCISIYDIFLEFQPLQRFIAELPSNHSLRGKNFLEVAVALDEDSNLSSSSATTTPVKRKINKVASVSPKCQDKSLTSSRLSNKVLVTTPSAQTLNSADRNRGTDNVSSRQHRAAFLRAARKLLFTTEFVLLIEYIEVIMPIFYCVLMVATYYLPNRAFYLTIAGKDEQELWSMINNILMYATLELLSLLILNQVLYRVTGISAMRQVGFVLDRQWEGIQSKLVPWTIYTLANSLQHYGADFSFQFKWLQSSTPTD